MEELGLLGFALVSPADAKHYRSKHSTSNRCSDRRVWTVAPALGAPVHRGGGRVAGTLDDNQQRALLEQKLAEIDGKRRQLGQMLPFLRTKLRDLPPR